MPAVHIDSRQLGCCSHCHMFGCFFSWLYCMSEDRMCNIPSPRNESTDSSLWLIQIIRMVKKRETIYFPLEAWGDSQRRQFSFQLRSVLVVSVYRAAIHFRDTEWMAAAQVGNTWGKKNDLSMNFLLLLIELIRSTISRQQEGEGGKGFI